MARYLRRSRRLAALLGLLVGLSSCDGDEGISPCEGDVTVGFSALSDMLVSVVYINDVRFEVIAGRAEGFHDGDQWTLLLTQGSILFVTPPCAASEIEIWLDDTQVALEAALYETPRSSQAILYDSSSTSPLTTPDDPPYVRWSIPAPIGARVGFVQLITSGSGCSDTCTSVLIRSVTFR